MTLDRSPEFCFKHLIYRYLLETCHALDDLPCGHVRSHSHNWNTFKCCLPANATYKISGLVVSDTNIFLYFSPYVSQCKKEFMTRKVHTHKLHTNPRHREEKSNNNDCLINSVTSKTMTF